MATNRPQPRVSDPNQKAPTLGEPLVYHGPGWAIETDKFEVICWAPGEIVHNGNPVGRTRKDWMLSVSIDPDGAPPDHVEESGLWACGSFMSGASIANVLPALAILEDADRFRITTVLVNELAGGSL